MRAAILLIASFIGFSATQAQPQPQAQPQTWRLRESATTLKGSHHEILPQPGGDILTITHPEAGHKGPMTISRFDARLNELYTRRITQLSAEQYQDAWYAAGRLFLFTTDKFGGLTRYELDDQSGALIGNPLPLTGLLGLPHHVKRASFYSGHSAAGDYHYIAASTETTLRGILFDAQGNKTTLFQYATATKPADLILTGNGDLCILFHEPPVETLLHITTAGVCKALLLSGLPTARTRCLSWSARRESLYFSALTSPAENTAFTDILTGTVDPATGTVSGLKHTATAALSRNGLPQDLTLLHTLPLSDGARLILFESSGRRLYRNQWSPAMQNPASALGRIGAGGFTSISPGTEGISYLSRGDVYVLRLDAANNPQWLDVLSKDQEESGRLTAIGVGCLVDPADNLHVFFYDNRNNADVWTANPTLVRADDPRNNAFACISISPNGTGTKQFIELTDDHYRLMPEIAFVENKGQACFLAIRARPGFSNELAFDRAGYKLGVISIK
jgi:hypothetical protein